MSRLRHSIKGLVRSLQVSGSQVIVFMEGHENDPYFYLKICDSVCGPAGVSFGHRLAKELPGDTGGKDRLISFFKYLRRKKLLISDFKGKTTAFLFFLDKDIDDLMRTLVRSPHVVYTKYYDVENHIFAAADLAESSAAAASLDRATIAAALGNYDRWRAGKAELWKDWIKICIFTRKKRIRGAGNFGVASRINDPPNGPVQNALVVGHLEGLQVATGLPRDEFNKAFGRVSKLVDGLFRNGEHDKVFKGKWYTIFLTSEIKGIAAGRQYNQRNLEGRLKTAAAMTVNFDAPWSEYFKEPLRAVVARL